MKGTSSAKTNTHRSSPSNTAAGELLLERLRILLNRLRDTTDILQNWPESDGDSAKIHHDTATDLIISKRRTVEALRSLERHVNGTGSVSSASADGFSSADISKEALEAFRKSLDEKCPIPLDLLDLLDIGNPFGLNPQCYARGLMKESLRQLAGLERRKRTLEMLGSAIEEGLEAQTKAEDERDRKKNGLREQGAAGRESRGSSKNKRKRDECGEEETENSGDEPPTKK